MAGILLLALIQAAGSACPPPPPPPAQRRATISTGDYPPEALRKRWEGAVGYTLEVDEQGRVERCTVTSSSGHAVLDRQTCKIMKRRARFVPGQDESCRPIGGTISSTLNWKIAR